MQDFLLPKLYPLVLRYFFFWCERFITFQNQVVEVGETHHFSTFKIALMICLLNSNRFYDNTVINYPQMKGKNEENKD